MVAHVCNLSTWEAEAEDCEFKATVCYVERLCINKQNKGKSVMAFSCNPSYSGGSWFEASVGKVSVRHYLKK
jgi:hypothetical protein